MTKVHGCFGPTRYQVVGPDVVSDWSKTQKHLLQGSRLKTIMSSSKYAFNTLKTALADLKRRSFTHWGVYLYFIHLKLSVPHSPCC